MTFVKRKIGSQRIVVLQDSGTNTAIIRRSLVTPDYLTGQCSSGVQVESTVRTLPEARVKVSTRYFPGMVLALCLEEPR